MISPRLYEIADQIKDKNSVVCDIGTDHALLPVFLIKSNRAKKIYAVDLKKNPLNQAKKNIKKYKIDKESIILILSDGLTWINNDLEVLNYCVISGLGGKKIVDILEHDSNKIEKYILCANDSEVSIRKWIKKSNYFIEKEILISDNNIIYLIIVINKKMGFKVKNIKDEIFGPYIRRNINENYINYWTLKYVKLNNYFFSLNKKTKKYKKLKKEKKLIKKEINRKIIN